MEVIDEDQGRSGQSAAGRLGFQYLLAEVSLDHVGIIFGLEMSRLARSNKDWHQLLELCAIFRTLLADQDGLYDPTDYNDRLLLGLKGTMSEAELHILRSRRYQGLLNKARRGEVFNHPPAGYVKLPTGEFALDPDEQVQSVIRLLFEQFERQGPCTACCTTWSIRASACRSGPMPVPTGDNWNGTAPTASPDKTCCIAPCTPVFTAGGSARSIRDAKWPADRTPVAPYALLRSVWCSWQTTAQPTSRPNASGRTKNAWQPTAHGPTTWEQSVTVRRCWVVYSFVVGVADACWSLTPTTARGSATVVRGPPSIMANRLVKVCRASVWIRW